MKIKKVYEVIYFVGYIDRLVEDIVEIWGKDLIYFVDFGFGQNYLGCIFVSLFYNKYIVVVESKEVNMVGVKDFDILLGLVEKEK